MVPGALVLLIGWLWDHSFVLKIILWVVTLDFTGSEKNWAPLFFPKAQSCWIMCLTQVVDRCIIRLLSWLLVNILVVILVECQWRVGQESVNSRSIHWPSGVPLSVNRGSSVGWQIDWLSVTIASVVRQQCIGELSFEYWQGITSGVLVDNWHCLWTNTCWTLLLITHIGCSWHQIDQLRNQHEISADTLATPPIRHMIHLVYAPPFSQGQNTPKSTPKVYEI